MNVSETTLKSEEISYDILSSRLQFDVNNSTPLAVVVISSSATPHS